jgi:tRNA A37 threonylcarbamoyladenosine biosynthesis protein TsaE
MGKHTPMNVMPGVMVVEWPCNAQALAHVKVSICLELFIQKTKKHYFNS